MSGAGRTVGCMRSPGHAHARLATSTDSAHAVASLQHQQPPSLPPPPTPSPIHQRTAATAAFQPGDLLWKLTLSIILPLLVGRSLRYFARVRSFAAANKGRLKVLSSTLLVLVPWVLVSSSAAQLRAISAGVFAVLLALGVGLHALLLAFNFSVARLLPIRLTERKSLVINASQKTINTAMSVVQFLPNTGAPGLAKGALMIPCLVSHFCQIVMDAVLASQWKAVTDDGAAGGEPRRPVAAAPGASPEPAGAVVVAGDAAQQHSLPLVRAAGASGAAVVDMQAVSGAGADTGGSWHEEPRFAPKRPVR